MTLPKPYYSRGDVTIYHADALELLPLMEAGSFDCVITDPPYGSTDADFERYKPSCPSVFLPVLMMLCKASGVVAVTAAEPFATDCITAVRKHFAYDLVWKKSMPLGFFDANRRPMRLHERILVFCPVSFYQSTFNPQKTSGKPWSRRRAGGGGCITQSEVYRSGSKRIDTESSGQRYPVSVLSVPNGNHRSPHPTAKPIDLMRWLVATYSNPGDVILDPFLGSGTTLVACARLGRRGIGIEIEEKYCAVAADRIDREIDQLKLNLEIAP